MLSQRAIRTSEFQTKGWHSYYNMVMVSTVQIRRRNIHSSICHSAHCLLTLKALGDCGFNFIHVFSTIELLRHKKANRLGGNYSSL